MDIAGKQLLIFANGEWRDGPAVRKALREKSGATVIAADGGVRHAQALGLSVHVLIGDLDSTTPELIDQLRAAGTVILGYPPDKDETDLELCLRWALSKGYRQLRILAALGGRADQHLSNILLLSAPEWKEIDLALVSGDEVLRVHRPGRHLFQGNTPARLSLIPLTPEVHEIHTAGLQYALRGENLHMSRSRGISNVFSAAQAEVTFTAGILLSIQQIM
jgi:thiamine pyrophosphokinase